MDISEINNAAVADGAPVPSPATNGAAAPAPTGSSAAFQTHVTREGGPMGLDPKGQPKQASSDTLVSLANEYGVPWTAIAMATFESTDPVVIANMLRDEGFGVSVDGHWLMSPGLHVKIPTIGPDGKPFKSEGFKIPTWAKVAGVGVLGAGLIWVVATLAGGSSKREEDDPDDEPEDDDE